MEMGEDFGEADFADDEDALSPISSTAKEVLGEDFDFDSLVPSNDAEESADAASKIPAPAPLIERDGGVYWAETSSVTNGTPAANLLPEQQEIVVVFPEEMVTDSIVEPDRSALAKQYSSVEESRPMLVRRKRKT